MATLTDSSATEATATPDPLVGKTHTLQVTLLYTDVWRVVEVPSDMTLAKVSEVLEEAMGWDDGPLPHLFRTRNRTWYGIPLDHGGRMEGRMLDSSLHKIGYVVWWEDMAMWCDYGLDEDDGYDLSIEVIDIKPADPHVELPRTVAGEGRVRQPW